MLYRSWERSTIRNLFMYVPSGKIMCRNICLLGHCCSSQLREKIFGLHSKTGESVRIPPSYPPGFDITVPIDYILWNVTKPGVSKYSEHPTLACPEQENLLTAE